MRRLIAAVLMSTPFSGLPAALPAGEVFVHFRDLQVVSAGQWTAPGVAPPPTDTSLPIVSGTADDPGAALLRSLDGRGSASGFQDILYDNRDRGHSRLDPELFPRLHHLKYGIELQASSFDYGLAGAIQYPVIVFGNSSTAVTGGPHARSQTRLAMTRPGEAARNAQLYRSNHIYVYPEHRDYDRFDRYPARWPYHIVSQGSSGSDQPVLRAVAATLAAFREDTRAALRERGLVAPTVEMVLRRNLRHVLSVEDYLRGAAHRPVVQKDELRPARMVAHAAALRPEDIPPMVIIDVIEEEFGARAGLAGLDERLFDTPSAVARIWRDFSHTKEILVSAESTEDPNGRSLTFSWQLLQGDPSRVTTATARISIDWHDAFDAPGLQRAGGRDRQTSRVDIGVFADNGRTQSAPAFVSVAFPTHQRRTYTADVAGWRLASIDYDAEGRGDYFDPFLYWTAGWRDTAVYDDAGTLTAWRRAFSGDTSGEMEVPAEAASGTYVLRGRGGRPVLEARLPETSAPD